MSSASNPSALSYFVPDPSRWPMVGAIALLCMAMGAAGAASSEPIESGQQEITATVSAVFSLR